VGPVVVEEHWCSQLGLIQADKVELILEDEISNDLLLLLTVEASDIEAHHCELLQLFQFTVVSPCLVVSLVRCVIPLVEGGVRLLLSPTILLWLGLDVLHLSVIAASSTADVIVVPLVLLMLWQSTMTLLGFLLLLGWRIHFGCSPLTLWWMRIRIRCPINWDRGLLGWGSVLCCFPDVRWSRITPKPQNPICFK